MLIILASDSDQRSEYDYIAPNLADMTTIRASPLIDHSSGVSKFSLNPMSWKIVTDSALEGKRSRLENIFSTIT